MTNPGIAAKIAASSDHAKHGTCPRCGAPVITARAGRVAALDVTADPQPLDLHGEILARLDGRLTWRLITTTLGIQRIAWRNPQFPSAHPVVADHVCPPQPVQEALL
ncbi:hypothetical protein [Streptomyces sp. NPDC056543]|uniref:hypothetical protein n=1 Tax=unclassified Streptomyces TaxID=2593676 RepID=UPI0036B5645C